MNEILICMIIAFSFGFSFAMIALLFDVLFSKGHIFEYVRLKAITKAINGNEELEKEFKEQLELYPFEKLGEGYDTPFKERLNKYSLFYWRVAYENKKVMKIVCPLCMGLRYVFPFSLIYPLLFYGFISFIPEFILIHIVISLGSFYYFINK